MDKHLLQDYEFYDDQPEYIAQVRFRTEDGPMGPNFVHVASGQWHDEEGATREALRHARCCARLEGRMTLLSLHIGRNRVKMLASPLLLEEVLAKEKEAADGNG